MLALYNQIHRTVSACNHHISELLDIDGNKLQLGSFVSHDVLGFKPKAMVHEFNSQDKNRYDASHCNAQLLPLGPIYCVKAIVYVRVYV